MKRLFVSLILAAATLCAAGQDYNWKVVTMDGSRSGCVTPSTDNVEAAIGRFEGNRYIAPSGKVFRKNSAAARVARVVLDAQPKMARVKEVVGFSTEAMLSHRPESPLSNWVIDLLMAHTEKLAGKEVHMGITNFGGIRMDMPEGTIILDDLLSMFPFKNYLVYIEHKGSQLRKIIEAMAPRFQVLGGVNIVYDNGKLTSVLVDGKPIDDDKVYGLATISFLLNGGDGLKLSENAVSVTSFEDVNIIDAVLAYVKAETEAGRPIAYQSDGRVVIKGNMERRR